MEDMYVYVCVCVCVYIHIHIYIYIHIHIYIQECAEHHRGTDDGGYAPDSGTQQNGRIPRGVCIKENT
jgi:hypothetical protein